MDCATLNNIETKLTEAQLLIKQNQFDAAINLTDLALKEVGNNYIRKEVLDSSTMKLVVAEELYEEGNAESSAKIKARILEYRIAMCKQKNNCH